jgi:hypothetical protein
MPTRMPSARRGVAVGEPIHVQPTGNPDGVHLGEPTGSAASYWFRARNALGSIPLGARRRSTRIVLHQNFLDARSGGKLRRIAGAGKGWVVSPGQRLRLPRRLRTYA